MTATNWESDSNESKSVINESNCDSNSEPDSDCESDYEPDSYLNINLKPSSDLYIIFKDKIPVGYLDELSNARNNMWYLARIYKSNFCYSYNTYIKEIDEDKIQVVGTHKFFIFSYETMFSTFEIYSAKKIVNKDTNEDTDKDTDKDANKDANKDTDDENQNTNDDTSQEKSSVKEGLRNRYGFF